MVDIDKIREENETVLKQWQAEVHAKNKGQLLSDMKELKWQIEQVTEPVPGMFIAIYWATESNCVLPLSSNAECKRLRRYNQPGMPDEEIEVSYCVPAE